MIDSRPRKRTADGIRIRPAGKPAVKKNIPAAPEKPAEKLAVPDTVPVQEELVVHAYAPAAAEVLPNVPEQMFDQAALHAHMQTEPPTETSRPADTGFAPWFSFPKKKNKGQSMDESERTLSERIVPLRASSRQYALRGMITGIILIGGAGIAMSTVLSRATIRVKPRIEAVAIQDVSVIFDAAVSQPVSGQKIIPAEHLHFTQASIQEVPASGTKYVEARSVGMVKISNQYSTAPQRLVAQTRFLTPSGVLFRLASPVVIPGAVLENGKLVPRSVEAQLIADAPGEEQNLSGPLSLKIPGFQGTPKYEGFTVVAVNGFSGGARGMKKVPSDADLQSAQEQVTKKAYDAMKQQIKEKIPPGFQLVDGLQEIRIIKVETAEEGEKLIVRATTEGDVLIFHEDDIAALLQDALLPPDNSKEFVADSMNIAYAVRTLNFDRKRADALLHGSVKTQQQLTVQQRDDLAAAVAGKKQGSVREFFNSRSDVTLSSVSLFPPWLSALPSNAAHIRIIEDAAD
ncbi:MAG: hypothetical protein HY617_03560 [Candidatus Sungbacteria bacterium]|nr:hypothetical protein [Candidatus Sungbacteria bacterium]